MTSSAEARAIYETLKEVGPPPRRDVPVALVDHYVGGINASHQFEGCGRATLALHNVVQGEFASGKLLHSVGALQFPDGYLAVGPLTPQGVPTGPECTIRWPNGETYRGALVNGVRHGHGCQTTMGGRARYEGEWRRGMRHGTGTQCYADGSRYEGDWQHDERHGRGTLWYASGDCYEGDWSHGERVGSGCMGWRHGTAQFVEIYQGTWCDGVPHGTGSSTYVRPVEENPSTSAAVSPAPADGEDSRSVAPSQYAAPVSAIVNRYVGDFAKGQRHGRGTFYYADGSSYEGHWEHGERSGKGLITTTVGSVVVVSAGVPVSSTALSDQAEVGLEPSMKENGPRRNRNAQLVPEVCVGDLRGLTDGTEEQFITTVTSLLLRYNTSLKALFTRYATVSSDVELLFTPADWWRQRTPGHLGVPQLLRLLSDAGIIGDGVTPSVFIRCVSIAEDHAAAAVRARLGERTTNPAVEAAHASKQALYRLNGSLHYRTFAEVLIRLAPVVCVGPRFRGLGEQVANLVESYLRAPLSTAPLFPCTRHHMAVLRSQATTLAALFDRAVSLQLPQSFPFLPAVVVLRGLEPILRRYGVSPMKAVSCMLPAYSSPDGQTRLLPPGLSEPRADLAVPLYTAAMGPNEELRLSTRVAEYELTVLDFVEILATITDLIISASTGNASPDVLGSFEETLNGSIVPTFEQYLNSL